VSIDPESATWRAVSTKAARAASEALERLVKHGQTIERTEYERGQIAAYQDILSMAQQPQGNPRKAP